MIARRTKIFLWVVCLFMLVACAKRQTPEEIALAAAEEAVISSYEQLLSGNYDKFMEGRSGNDSLPESYREQLLASCKQFIAQQERLHQGIRSINVSNSNIDSTQHLIQVFLILNYGDSTQEEIVVPVVERDGEWKMK